MTDFFDSPSLKRVEASLLLNPKPSFTDPFENLEAGLFDLNANVRCGREHRGRGDGGMRMEEDSRYKSLRPVISTDRMKMPKTDVLGIR